MPTPYTNCKECFVPTIYDTDTEISQQNYPNPYKIHMDISDILMKYGLPKEITEIIIKKSINLKQCDYCSSILCKEHQTRANKWAKYYQHADGLMCNQCSWWWVT